MARSPQCGRCETSCALLTSVILGLDDETVRLSLCAKCARNCRADIHGWKLYGTPVRNSLRPVPMTPLPRSVFNALPPAVPSTAGRDNVTVPFPIIKRQPVVSEKPDSETVYPEILNGHSLPAVQRAADRWRWRTGCRSTVLERDLDPVDVLLAADTDEPDEVIPDRNVPNIQLRRYRGLKVVVATDSRTILDAYV